MFVTLYMHCIGQNIYYGDHTVRASELFTLGALHEVHDYKLKPTYQGFEELCDDLLTKLTKVQEQLIQELQKGTHVCMECMDGSTSSLLSPNITPLRTLF